MPRMRRLLLTLFVTGKVSAILLWVSGGNLWLGLICFAGPALVLFYHLFVPGAQGLGRVQTRFRTRRREIWLTIDDGPDEVDTPRTLALLARHGARATFFLIGERAAQMPHLVRAIVEAGHEIGHHTHTHPSGSFWCAGPARVRRELDQALAAYAASGVRPRWFRPPAGIKNVWLDPELRRRGLRHVGWSLRSLDTIRRDPAAVLARVERRVRPGDIVVLHEGPRLHPRVRRHALERLLPALARRGYACVLPPPDNLPAPPVVVLPGLSGAATTGTAMGARTLKSHPSAA
jgi:peptidoglycan-N-acetylglucosamine deacetylase